MKQLMFSLLFLTLSILVYSQTLRGRVQIHNGTLITDKGTLLRGAYISTDVLNYMPGEAEISGIKELGLNCIHLYAECAAITDSAGENYVTVDSIVNMTERDSLYLVITIGNCGEEGSFDSAFVNDFWKFYAPRYKNKAHVIYEIMNEPFTWSAPYDSRTLAMERWAYDTIRFYAPETHILFMSYAGSENVDSAIQDIKKLGNIDWSNASIATHGYSTSSEVFRLFLKTFIDSGYAITCTEFESIENSIVNLAFTRVFEQEFISYLHFIQIAGVVNDPSVFKSFIESSEIRWDPDFSTWPASLTEINYKNPYQNYEAGFYDEGLGFKLHFLKTTIGYINQNDYVAYYNFDFEDGPDSLIFECSAGNSGENSGSIELVLDSLNGTSVGLYPITHTESWDNYQIFRFPVTFPFEGINKIYFVFKADHPWDLMNLKSFTFIRADSINKSITLPDKQAFQVYPNPGEGMFNLSFNKTVCNRVIVTITNLQGIKVLENAFSASKDATIDLSNFPSGVYRVNVYTNKESFSTVILKK